MCCWSHLEESKHHQEVDSGENSGLKAQIEQRKKPSLEQVTRRIVVMLPERIEMMEREEHNMQCSAKAPEPDSLHAMQVMHRFLQKSLGDYNTGHAHLYLPRAPPAHKVLINTLLEKQHHANCFRMSRLRHPRTFFHHPTPLHPISPSHQSH